MNGITGFLIVLGVAGCSGGGGGASPHDAASTSDGNGIGQDAHVGDAGVRASGGDHCATATPISLSTMHSDLPASTIGATADLAAPCGTAGTPDVFFTFTLTRREMVYADTFGASSPTALYFATSCTTAATGSTTPGDAVCSTGACGTSQSQVTALLDPGTYYLVLAGTGAAMIHFQHAEVGTGTVDYLAQGSSAPTGTTSGFGGLYACDAGGAENAYWWQTCPSNAGGVFQASTCTGTNFDTILTLQIPGVEAVICDDDTCSTQSTVGANIAAGAGLYVIDVDGNSSASHGNYMLTASRP